MKNKILIVDHVKDRHDEFFSPLKDKFPDGQIIIQMTVHQTEENGTLDYRDLSKVGLLFIHQSNPYRDAFIERAKASNTRVVRYTRRGESAAGYRNSIVCVNYEDHLIPNLEDFLIEYFEGDCNFEILMYGLDEAQRRQQARQAQDYIMPLAGFYLALHAAFDLNRPEVFLEEQTSEETDVFKTLASPISHRRQGFFSEVLDLEHPFLGT